MRNSFGLVFAILLLAVMGCACPRLDSLLGKKPLPPPPPAAPSANSVSAPAAPGAASKVPGDLTLAQYNQIKDKMARSEVERILGGPGTEVSSSSGGGMTFGVYQWQTEDFKTVIVSFQDDKVMSKTQVGLD